MQLGEQNFLTLVEKTKKIAFVDIEATGLRGDYNSVLVVVVKPYGGKAKVFKVKQAGNDKKVVREVKEELEKYEAWVTFYGKGYDIPMLNTRLLRWRINPIEKRPHVDLYYTLKYNTLMSRRGQGAVLRFLGTAQEKMDMSPEAWNEVITNPKGRPMQQMIARCVSDVEGLEAMYKETRHLIRDIKR
jgi:uncharacterized protein YprB with RNaseH-like and TPR domain